MCVCPQTHSFTQSLTPALFLWNCQITIILFLKEKIDTHFNLQCWQKTLEERENTSLWTKIILHFKMCIKCCLLSVCGIAYLLSILTLISVHWHFRLTIRGCVLWKKKRNVRHQNFCYTNSFHPWDFICNKLLFIPWYTSSSHSSLLMISTDVIIFYYELKLSHWKQKLLNNC